LKHKAAETNEEIVNDSDMTDNEKIKDIRSEQTISLVSKRRKIIHRRVSYLNAKIIVKKKHFIGRKQSKKVGGIVKNYQ